MKQQYVLCLLVAFATNSIAADGWVSVDKKSTSYQQRTKNKSHTASSSVVNELLSQVQMMQQEIAQLRGMVEQQGNQIRTLERKQTKSYQDVDKRLQALSKQNAKPSGSASATQAATKGSKVATYKQAMQLVRSKKYNQAISAFSRFYKANPNSSLAPNALYWTGEIYMVKGDLKKAKSSFLQVIKKFPKHAKSADSHYKLAVITHKQGNAKAAKAELKKLIKDYSGKSKRTVALAKSYLKRL